MRVTQLLCKNRKMDSTIRWRDLAARMTSKPTAQELYEVTESASRKHVEDIQARKADLPAIDWDAYAKAIGRAGSLDVLAFKQMYDKLEVPYPEDVDGRLEDAKAKDMEIKELKDEALEEVRKRKESYDRDITFWRNVPEARQMTYEMYLELLPNSAMVVPKTRDEYETELETAQADLDDFAKKREERKNFQ